VEEKNVGVRKGGLKRTTTVSRSFVYGQLEESVGYLKEKDMRVAVILERRTETNEPMSSEEGRTSWSSRRRCIVPSDGQDRGWGAYMYEQYSLDGSPLAVKIKISLESLDSRVHGRVFLGLRVLWAASQEWEDDKCLICDELKARGTRKGGVLEDVVR
jgi:hypothetical protein